MTPDGTPIVPGTAGNDTFHVSQGGTILAGGAGADTFVFEQLVLDTPAPATHIAEYSALQGDIIDVSAIVTLPAMPVTRGGAMPAPPAPDSMVRVSEGASGAFAALEVNTAGWTEVAQLDGVHAGDSVNVVLDQTTPGEERARPTLVRQNRYSKSALGDGGLEARGMTRNRQRRLNPQLRNSPERRSFLGVAGT
jgi:hypothetical protein